MACSCHRGVRTPPNAGVQNDTSLIILDYGWRESHSLPTATHSGSGAAAPTGLLPPPLGPPLRGPLTPVPLVQREYHLPLPLAGYQSLCVSSQLSASLHSAHCYPAHDSSQFSASALCSNANHFILVHCSLLSSSWHFSSLCICTHSIYLLFIKNNCYLAQQVARCCRMHALTSFTTRIGCCSTHVR
jgi:hypothetical protein